MASRADEHHTGKTEKCILSLLRSGSSLAERVHSHTLLQAFEWHTPGGGRHWQWLRNQLPQLADMGITAVWLPPPTKGGSADSVGYDLYDLWDLGEFDAKGGKATRWGTIEDLRELVKTANEHNIVLIADAVLNHKANGDEKETFRVVEVDNEDRNKEVSEAHDIDAWTHFTFPARNGKYSDLQWTFNLFSGVDYDDKTQKTAIYRILGDGKNWSQSVDESENGNFDYLMCNDIDHSHPDVKTDLIKWGQWMVHDIGFRGFRMDAARHISENFMRAWIKAIRDDLGAPVFAVAEYFHEEVGLLTSYLEKFGEQFSLFDTPLHHNFYEAGLEMRNYDLRKIFDGSLVQARPIDAVTFVGNHDTQRGQTCEAVVNPAFRPLAYALILLRYEGYPCIFGGDLWGIAGEHEEPAVNQLSDLIRARRDFAYGETRDYWDHPQTIGWVRTGDKEHDGCAVILSTGDEGTKRMEVGKEHAGKTYTDLLGWHQGEIKIEDDGWAEFRCSSESMSVWTDKEASRRERYHK